jgi:hypothetical protein
LSIFILTLSSESVGKEPGDWFSGVVKAMKNDSEEE